MQSRTLPRAARNGRGTGRGPGRSATKPLSKVPSGIDGLDEITDGGLPRGRPALLCGGPGCGKTLFGFDLPRLESQKKLQILALPTPVRKLPEPMRKIIGDLSHEERVLIGLDLRPA